AIAINAERRDRIAPLVDGEEEAAIGTGDDLLAGVVGADDLGQVNLASAAGGELADLVKAALGVAAEGQDRVVVGDGAVGLGEGRGDGRGHAPVFQAFEGGPDAGLARGGAAGTIPERREQTHEETSMRKKKRTTSDGIPAARGEG